MQQFGKPAATTRIRQAQLFKCCVRLRVNNICETRRVVIDSNETSLDLITTVNVSSSARRRAHLSSISGVTSRLRRYGH